MRKMQRMNETPPVDPAQFAKLVAQVSDDDLAVGLRENRDFILDQVFTRMPDHLDAERAREADFVIEWRVRELEGDGFDRWQIRVAAGRAEVERDGGAEPTAVITIGAIDFMRLVAGNLDPAQLYLTGRLAVDGDVMTAATLGSYFRFPSQERS